MDHKSARGHQEGAKNDVELYQGPIPPPHILSHYKEIDPQFPAIILKMATDEQAQRHSEETKNNRIQRAVLRSDAMIRFFIPIGAVVVVLGILALAAYAFYSKQEWGGSIVSVTFIGAVLIGFSRLMFQTKNNIPNTFKKK